MVAARPSLNDLVDFMSRRFREIFALTNEKWSILDILWDNWKNKAMGCIFLCKETITKREHSQFYWKRQEFYSSCSPICLRRIFGEEMSSIWVEPWNTSDCGIYVQQRGHRRSERPEIRAQKNIRFYNCHIWLQKTIAIRSFISFLFSIVLIIAWMDTYRIGIYRFCGVQRLTQQL